MIAEVASRRDEIASICRRYGVRRLDVFGSAATGAFDPVRSDVDFLVEYPDGYDFGLWLVRYFDLKDELSALFRRPVDLVMSEAKNNATFWDSANASREMIFDASEVGAMAR